MDAWTILGNNYLNLTHNHLAYQPINMTDNTTVPRVYIKWHDREQSECVKWFIYTVFLNLKDAHSLNGSSL